MLERSMNISDFDPELFDAINKETARQEEHIELIASENYCSPRVLEAQGSQLTNKYAEGYSGKRGRAQAVADRHKIVSFSDQSQPIPLQHFVTSFIGTGKKKTI